MPLSTFQERVYSLISRRLAPPLETGCVDALRQGIKAGHVVIRGGEWALTDAGKAEFLFAKECA